MTISNEARTWHSMYEEAPQSVRFAVDKAYTVARRALEESGYKARSDDDAEVLIAAIMQYLYVSNETLLESRSV